MTIFSTREQASWYLSGLIDGEGYVSRMGKESAKVCIFNTELSIIHAAQEALDLLDIPYKMYSARRQSKHLELWNVYIGGLHDVKKLAGLVQLQSQPKADRLDIIKNYRKQKLSVHERPISEIERLYIHEEMTVKEISLLVGWKMSTVYKWIREAGLSRSASEAGLLRIRKKNGQFG